MARLTNAALAHAGLAEGVIVGDARRGLEVVDELTMIAAGDRDARPWARALRGVEACRSVEIDRSGAVRMAFAGGGPAVLRIVPRQRFLEALVRETGSERHVRWLESRAGRVGGLTAACARVETEQALYDSLGLPFAPPELRDKPTPRVPDLVDGVRGVFHVHTDWSDGSASIAEMARAAKKGGFGYLGISDHSRAAVYARGLDSERLRAQARVLREAREQVPDVLVLHGVEVDILPDGSLDLDDVTLGSLDFVIASVHESLDQSSREMTGRLVRAVSHPLVTILGHPTGRLLLGRKGYAFDLDSVAAAASANDTLLEINANPHRLDLSAGLAHRAARRGACFAIDPDAHAPHALDDTGLGVIVARRAGLGPEQILNARTAVDLAAHLAARREKAKRRLGLI
jgi:DNA polymerase (family 10)